MSGMILQIIRSLKIAPFFFVTAAKSAVIFYDNFDSGTRQSAGYYISRTNATEGLATAVVDTGGIGSLVWSRNNALNAPSVLWKNFDSIDLTGMELGSKIVFSMGVTFSNFPVQNNGFRVGLYDFDGVRTNDAGGSNPPELRDSEGYYFAVGQSSTSTQSRLTRFDGNNTGPAGSNTGSSTNLAAANSFKVNIGATRYYWLEITKTTSGLHVAWYQNTTSNRSTATLNFQGIDSNPVTYSFDGVALTLISGGAATYIFDWMKLEAFLYPLPEPTTVSLFSLALAGLYALRRHIKPPPE